MIVLFKEVNSAYEKVDEFGDDLEAAKTAASKLNGWQIENQTEMGTVILLTSVEIKNTQEMYDNRLKMTPT